MAWPGLGARPLAPGLDSRLTAFIMEITGIASSSAQVCVMR